jgi:general secretion pathway protein K
MKVSPARKDSGFAVIVALIAVTVLTMMAGAFAYAMKIETKLAANTNDDEQFYWIGRGGVDRACWWLSLEANQPFSSLQQYWAGGPGEGPETNGPLAGESLSNFQIGEGTVSLKMTEQESKINVNTATSPLIQQVLTLQGADAGSISEVSDSIMDWVSPGDTPRPGGAKSDYYLGLDPPYFAKDAPIDNPDEIMLIKGVTRAMYYGGSDSGNSSTLPSHQLGFGHAPGQEPVYAFGLKDVFTPYSSGKINLLTADDTVLQLIPGMDTTTAQALETARESDPPIRDPGTLLAAAGLNNNADGARQILQFVTTQGSCYEVEATVTIGQLTHTYKAILYRNGTTVTVFNFYRSN